MEQEILDLIKRQLPEHVGSALRERLVQADKDAEAVKAQAEKLKQYSDNVRGLGEQVGKLLSVVGDKAVLDLREKDIEKRERDLELTLARNAYKESEESRQQLFQLIGLVFKNPIYKETIARSTSSYAPNGMSTGDTGSESVIKEVE